MHTAGRARPLCRVGVLLLLLANLSPFASARRTLVQKKQLAAQQFETAEKMREALNGKPQSERTRRDYNRVTDAFRKVYLITPNFRKADESIVDVAELLAETGRAFHDEKASNDAIARYEFLMREYPGSRHITAAMFTIGKIYEDDLGDNEKAKAAFEDFLKKHPRHQLSDDARQAIEEIDHPKSAGKKKLEETRNNVKKAAAPPVEDNQEDEDKSHAESVSHPAPGKLPLVTGIRHWSTPDYTRVAIDIENEVQYEAGRIPSPERIFFDLRNTKLASELTGKSFDVDDGFLRKIRVAQYQRGMTRVVLEVDPVSEYSAFLLPNPYRLIIDIHGKQPAAKTLVATETAAKESKEAVSASGKEQPVAAKTIAPSASALPASTKAAPKDSAGNQNAKASSKSLDKSGNADTATVHTTPVKSILDVNHDNASLKKKSPAASATEEETEDTARAASAEKKEEAQAKPTTKPTTAPTFQEVAPREERLTKDFKNDRRKSAGKDSKAKELAAVSREAQPASDGQRSLIRALGLKIGKIVVDAGHGGHDTGTVGPNGLQEKDLVLDVALRLGKLLSNKMGADVVYTRNDDTFIPLETRTAIANQNQADLFISVHANSSQDASARGVETYYLNFTSSADALEVAARENAVSEKSIHELQDLVKKIALKEKIEESREFAADVQSAMRAGLSNRSLKMRDRGVKKAPFIVLIGANMPSILAEISFVSNPSDERKLKTPEYRQKIAESLYRGITKYVAGLSGVKLASARQGQ